MRSREKRELRESLEEAKITFVKEKEAFMKEIHFLRDELEEERKQHKMREKELESELMRERKVMEGAERKINRLEEEGERMRQNNKRLKEASRRRDEEENDVIEGEVHMRLKRETKKLHSTVWKGIRRDVRVKVLGLHSDLYSLKSEMMMELAEISGDLDAGLRNVMKGAEEVQSNSSSRHFSRNKSVETTIDNPLFVNQSHQNPIVVDDEKDEDSLSLINHKEIEFNEEEGEEERVSVSSTMFVTQSKHQTSLLKATKSTIKLEGSPPLSFRFDRVVVGEKPYSVSPMDFDMNLASSFLFINLSSQSHPDSTSHLFSSKVKGKKRRRGGLIPAFIHTLFSNSTKNQDNDMETEKEEDEFIITASLFQLDEFGEFSDLLLCSEDGTPTKTDPSSDLFTQLSGLQLRSMSGWADISPYLEAKISPSNHTFFLFITPSSSFLWALLSPTPPLSLSAVYGSELEFLSLCQFLSNPLDQTVIPLTSMLQVYHFR